MTKTFYSNIPSYFPNVTFQCSVGSTLPTVTLENGQSVNFQVDQISTLRCTVRWGSAYLDVRPAGSGFNATYQVDEDGVTLTEGIGAGASVKWSG